MTQVRLLFANLGMDAGDIVEMDDEQAKAWCHRKLVEPIDGETGFMRMAPSAPEEAVAERTAAAEVAQATKQAEESRRFYATLPEVTPRPGI